MSDPIDPEWENTTLFVQRIMKRDGVTNVKDLDAEIAKVVKRGGVLGGNMSREEEWVFLPSLWRFDYMGAAEFEWGQQAQCLDVMKGYIADSSCDDIVHTELELTFNPSNGGSWMETASKGAKDRWASKYRQEPYTAPIYLISFRGHVEPLTELLRRFQNYENGTRCKEEPLIWQSFMATNPSDYHATIHGWWDLTNGWLAFKDKELFLETCKALGPVR